MSKSVMKRVFTQKWAAMYGDKPYAESDFMMFVTGWNSANTFVESQNKDREREDRNRQEQGGP